VKKFNFTSFVSPFEAIKLLIKYNSFPYNIEHAEDFEKERGAISRAKVCLYFV
jgi:hypothetical protein